MRIRVLFVCMGNICRSPAGEGVFQSMVEDAGLSDRVEIDSAGTLGYHSGEPADVRMTKAASQRGYQLSSRARQIKASDLNDFDIILTMDLDNMSHVLGMAQDEVQQAKVRSFGQYCRQHTVDSVPDPYYGGEQGFEVVLDLLEDGCQMLLEEVERQLL